MGQHERHRRRLARAGGKLAATGNDIRVQFALPGAAIQDRAISAATPLLETSTRQTGPIGITAAPGAGNLALLTDTDYVPAPVGSAAKAAPHGFVLARSLFRVPAEGPMQRLPAEPDGSLHVQVGDLVEEVDELVNPEARTNVAMRLPLPAGMEPLNPNLATAPANAAPSAGPTLAPDYAAYDDDQILIVYQTLPQGTYTFRTRMRATVDGSFTQPPALVETMYQRGVTGGRDGARVVVGR